MVITSLRPSPGGCCCFQISVWVDCSVCADASEGAGVLSDLWGTRISYTTAILNITHNPLGLEGRVAVRNSSIEQTPCWDRKPIDKPPCIPCGTTEQVRGRKECLSGHYGDCQTSVQSYFCPFTWVTQPLTVFAHSGLLFSPAFSLSLSLSAITMARCIVHFFPDVFLVLLKL